MRVQGTQTLTLSLFLLLLAYFLALISLSQPDDGRRSTVMNSLAESFPLTALDRDAPRLVPQQGVAEARLLAAFDALATLPGADVLGAPVDSLAPGDRLRIALPLAPEALAPPVGLAETLAQVPEQYLIRLMLPAGPGVRPRLAALGARLVDQGVGAENLALALLLTPDESDPRLIVDIVVGPATSRGRP